MALESHIALRHAQRLAHRDQDLLLHQVDAGHFFGDRMLDLDALVDFQEIEIAVVVDEELDRARVGVAGHLGHANGRFAHLLPQILEFVLDQRRGRFFHDLLVAPLNRAIPFAQMDDVAAGVAQNLEFDMMRVFDVLLDVNAGIAKGLFRFGPGGVIAL